MLHNLRNAGVSLCTQSRDGKTALHGAVQHYQTEALRVLLFYKVDAHIADNDGNTPLHLAAFNGNVMPASLRLL